MRVRQDHPGCWRSIAGVSRIIIADPQNSTHPAPLIHMLLTRPAQGAGPAGPVPGLETAPANYKASRRAAVISESRAGPGARAHGPDARTHKDSDALASCTHSCRYLRRRSCARTSKRSLIRTVCARARARIRYPGLHMCMRAGVQKSVRKYWRVVLAGAHTVTRARPSVEARRHVHAFLACRHAHTPPSAHAQASARR